MSVDTSYDVDDGFGGGFGNGDGRRRWPIILFAVLLVVVALGAIIATWLKGQIDPSGPPGAEIHLTIANGQSTGQIADLLHERGVVKSATVFRYYARFKGADEIKAGDFTFHHNEHMGEVIKTLERGPEVRADRITIPEGLVLTEIADKVGALPGRSAQRFMEVAKSGTIRSKFQPAGSTNLEGLVLPETYFVDRDDDEAQILTRMVTAFDKHADQIGLPAAAQRLGLTPYEVVIVASMVEREARLDEDRAPIARVIYNRLDEGMPLGIDATVQYALGGRKEDLTKSDLAIESPYNTRNRTGLPPGPIASPGPESLQASLDPPPSPYLFYVLANANGKHAFATNGAEFDRLVAAARAKGLL